MRKPFGLVMVSLAVGAVFLAGCKKDDGSGPTTDPPGVVNESTAMQYSAQTDAFVQNDEVTFADSAVTDANYSTFGKVDSAIVPYRWGRFINPGGITRTETVTVLPGDTLAIVKVDKDINGNFAILAKAQPTDTAFILIQKPFHDHSVRYILFKRITRTGFFMGRWLAVASSLVNGATVPPDNNISIQSATVYYSNGDSLTVTNPDTTFLLYRWLNWFVRTRKDVPVYVPGDRVKLSVTVVSKDASGDLVALRYGVFGRYHKRALLDLVPGSEVDHHDGTFTRTYVTSTNPLRYLYMHYHTGWFNLGIDAVTKSTFTDSSAPYSAAWWGVPYRVN